MTNYYDSGSQTLKPIPDAPYYVTSHDSFMSGWGMAEGKVNICVRPCKDLEEADRVVRYTENRNDQKRIKITTRKPPTKRGTLYSLVSWGDVT